MANYLTTDTDLTAVANAIRSKGGTSGALSFPNGFISAIQNLGGDGLTNEIKQALLQIGQKVAYIDTEGQQYYNDLMAALYPVDSISAVFTQGSAIIYDTDSLDTLKQYLVVTANYSDGTSATVTNYTLSGTLTEGTSTITVSYGGQTATFSVIVSISLDSIAYGTLTYRQLFITNNIVPIGDFEETLTLSSSWVNYAGDSNRKYKINAGSPSVSTTKCVSPTHSLKCFGSSSAQIQYIDNNSTSGTYLACASINVSRYSKGKAGISVYFTAGVEAINISKQEVTDGWVHLVGSGSVSGSSPTLSIYIGSMNSANLDCYVDDVIITPLPNGLSEADALVLYNKYLAIREAET